MGNSRKIDLMSKCGKLAVAISIAPVSVAHAQDQAVSGGQVESVDTSQATNQIPGIVVTANKRNENARNVGLSITAVSGDDLEMLGINSLSDFSRIEPSFTFGQSLSGSPTYTIRGFGYHDFSLAAPPAVSVYMDEVPFAFPVMTTGANFDLERVEILKGPQGALFGQNSTGGAINFIAAAPTSELHAGIEATYARFGALNVNGFVSGPLSDTLEGRFAFDIDQGGAWQESVQRDDQLGDRRFFRARGILRWEPSPDLAVVLNISGFTDRSDTQAGQLTGVFDPVDDVLNFLPDLLDQPLTPENPRAAEWDPGIDYRLDQEFWQASLRADWSIADDIMLTSITAYADYQQDDLYGFDGVDTANNAGRNAGEINSYFQELRLGGEIDNSHNWLIGANYSRNESLDDQIAILADASQSFAFVPFGEPRWEATNNRARSTVDTWALFANGKYQLTDELAVNVGARYTDSEDRHTACTYDTGDGLWAGGMTALQATFKSFGLGSGPVVPIPAGGCATLDNTLTPAMFRDTLHEDNLSWRVGLDWQVSDDALLYANVSRGYKQGAYTNFTALLQTALVPATQESVLFYEAGFKTSWLERRLQIDGAIFYGDYNDKQIGGVIPEPLVFGSLFGLVNVPQSRVAGFELAITAIPFDGLTLTASTAYIDSEVTESYMTSDVLGVVKDIVGEPFPFTPKWTFILGANYEWDVGDEWRAYVGASYNYRSSTQSAFGMIPESRIDSYGLLDLRAGIRQEEGWSLELFGANVANTHYWNDAGLLSDTLYRRAGRPATYGVRVGHRF